MKKISNQLLKGYILILIMIVTIGGVLYISYNSFLNTQIDAQTVDMTQFIDDYSVDPEYAFSNNEFEASDFLIITDQDYNIVDTYNYNLIGDVTFHDIQVSNTMDGITTYYTFDDEYSNLIFHLYLGPYYENTQILYMFVGLALLLFIVLALLFAKATSKNIVEPIKQLELGVNEISKGNYQHTIDYAIGNELDTIKDTINTLSHELNAEKEHREKLEAEKNDLILSLSHDIKTPLTNIIGYSQALSMKVLDPEIKRHVDTIYKYGLTATQLTDELFDYAKLNNKVSFITEKIDIVELTRLKLIDYIHEFDVKNINYTFELPDEHINCNLNTTMYYRVLDNLLQNSIKYNHKDFSITIKLISKLTTVQIILEDDGVGIPESYHDSIFNPMVRVDSSRNRELGGTGLGLSIVSQIIQRHHGKISLDSSYTDGCRFIIEIPKEN